MKKYQKVFAAMVLSVLMVSIMAFVGTQYAEANFTHRSAVLECGTSACNSYRTRATATVSAGGVTVRARLSRTASGWVTSTASSLVSGNPTAQAVSSAISIPAPPVIASWTPS